MNLIEFYFNENSPFIGYANSEWLYVIIPHYVSYTIVVTQCLIVSEKTSTKGHQCLPFWSQT